MFCRGRRHRKENTLQFHHRRRSGEGHRRISARAARQVRPPKARARASRRRRTQDQDRSLAHLQARRCSEGDSCRRQQHAAAPLHPAAKPASPLAAVRKACRRRPPAPVAAKPAAPAGVPAAEGDSSSCCARGTAAGSSVDKARRAPRSRLSRTRIVRAATPAAARRLITPQPRQAPRIVVPPPTLPQLQQRRSNAKPPRLHRRSKRAVRSHRRSPQRRRTAHSVRRIQAAPRIRASRSHRRGG